MGIVITLLIMGIILAVLWGFGYSFTRSGWQGVRDARKSLEWPATSGKILSLMVEEQKPIISDSSRNKTITYRPRMQ